MNWFQQFQAGRNLDKCKNVRASFIEEEDGTYGIMLSTLPPEKSFSWSATGMTVYEFRDFLEEALALLD